MRNIEHLHAKALINWWALYAKKHGIDERLLMAIPNGGHRNIIVAAKMKAEGVRRGAPDYLLAYPKGKCAGLFLEIKAPGGRLSDAQKEMIELLKARQYKCEVAFGWDAARLVIEGYLS